MSLKEDFQSASERVNNLPEKPSNTVLLRLYALYKQSTEGDITGEKPGGFDFKAIAKYTAWEGLKGMDQEEAMQEYIDLVVKLEAEA